MNDTKTMNRHLQQEIEVILARHLAEYLAMPMFIVDQDGNLIFFNEPAETILELRYQDSGTFSADDLATVFEPVDKYGNPITSEQLPIMIAITKKHPVHDTFWIRSLEGKLRQIEVTAIPLLVQGDRFLGAMSIFWEVQE